MAILKRSWLALASACLSLASAFTNPIKTLNGSDPFMVFYDGMYYLTTTTWSDVEITAASTIEGLKTATPQIIYSDRSNPARAANWWAPEIWRLDGRWYAYFSTSVSSSDWGIILPSLTVWVLEGGTGSPLSEPFTLVGSVCPSNYAGGMLDATTYEINGKRYFIYSAVDGPESPNGASLWAAELTSPTTVGPATMIAYPTLDWEKTVSGVLEGPAGITSPNGDLWIVYSADSCNGPVYKLGALKYTPGADPLLPSSWTKLEKPLLQTNETEGIYAPGHNGFFKSPDGTQDWIVYHANRESNGSCGAYRQTFVKQVSWSADGTPILAPPALPGEEVTEPSGHELDAV